MSNFFDDDKSKIQDGVEFVSNLKSNITEIADALAEKKYQDSFLPIVTLKDCIQYFKDESKKMEATIVASGFVLSVKKNIDPRNQNDYFVIIQGLIDNHNKPIVYNGETMSRILHAKTIDSALIRALDGNETRVFKV